MHAVVDDLQDRDILNQEIGIIRISEESEMHDCGNLTTGFGNTHVAPQLNESHT